MIRNEDVTVLFPARDEEGTIGDLVAEAVRTCPGAEVIGGDDGSADATAERARAAGARVVAHPFPAGNGAAIKTGIRAAGRPVLVILDADGQHAPSEIPRLLSAMAEVDMAVGSRPAWAHPSRVRGWGNRALAGIASWLAETPIADLTCGFRALRTDLARDCLPLLPQGYSTPTTLTMALLERGAFVRFVRLERAGERRGGRSRISLGADGLRFLRILLRMGIAFHPERFFGTLAGGIGAAGALLTAWKWLRGGELYATVLIFLMSAFFTFLFGLLAGQIVHLRREIARRGEGAEAAVRSGAVAGGSGDPSRKA